MKFLLEVCVSSRSLSNYLIGEGHDVLSAINVDPHASDEQLMALALQDNRVLLTEDRDFGELTFVRNLPHGPLVRMVGLSVAEQVQGIAEFAVDGIGSSVTRWVAVPLNLPGCCSTVRRIRYSCAQPWEGNLRSA